MAGPRPTVPDRSAGTKLYAVHKISILKYLPHRAIPGQRSEFFDFNDTKVYEGSTTVRPILETNCIILTSGSIDGWTSDV